MEDLFGVKMQWIMYVLLAVFIPSLAVIGFMGLRNRVMLKMALRNIPRRKAQTVLIIVGIMISTLIMAASFGTGDTLTHSIRKSVVDGLGTIDQIVLSARAGENAQFGGAAYVPVERFTQLQRQLADNPDIDGLAAGLAETAPTVSDRTGLSAGRMRVAGVDPATLQGFGDFQLLDGGAVRVEELAAGEIFINADAAEELDARAGDTLTVYIYGEAQSMTVKGVVQSGGNAGSQPTLLLPLDRAQTLFGREGQINSIVVSNRGDAFSGAELSDEVTKTLRVLFTDRAAAGQLKAALNHPEVLAQLDQRAGSLRLSQETRDNLALLQAELVKPELSDDLMALFSDGDRPRRNAGGGGGHQRPGFGAGSGVAAGIAGRVYGQRSEARSIGYGGTGGQHGDQLFHPVRAVFHYGRHPADFPDFRNAGGGAAFRVGHGAGGGRPALAPGADVRL